MALSAKELLTRALGKRTLTPNEETIVPEVERFLRINPNDTNFVLTPSEGSGFGQLVCMEDSCFEEMNLDPHPLLPDGGLSRGFGGLTKYQEHINSKPEHVKARDKRVATEAVIKAEAPPESLRKPKAREDRKPNINSTPIASGSSSKSKPTASSSSAGPPKKRASDIGPRSSAGDVFSDDIVEKKPKLDPDPGVLAQSQYQNGTASATGPHIDEYAVLKRKIERWNEVAKGIHDIPDRIKTDDDYKLLGEANDELVKLNTRERAWRARHGNPPAGMGVVSQVAAAPVARAATQPGPGMPPANAAAAAAAIAQQVPGAYPHLGQIANALAGPYNANDPMGAAIRAMQGYQHAAQDDGDSDEERMWGQVSHITNEDFDAFVKKATEGESFEGDADVDAAAEIIGLKSQKDRLPHMNINLMAHQLIGCAWMKQQEESKHFGGILGDEMGLGKTVEAIACALINESSDPKEKTNLVVAPLALLEQWKTEIEEKIEDGYWSVVIYHGPERKKYNKKKLSKYNWVLTTYQTLVGEYPNEEGAIAKAEKQAKKEGGQWEDYVEIGEKGPLLQMDWYRIILDEAQNIRNRNTQISKAVTELESIYRWALSGTPVTNSLADIYPLLRFLQIKPWYEWKYFNETISKIEKKQPGLAGRKAQGVLRACMLRRKKDSKLNGRELISLPDKTVELREIEFSEEEREIYTLIETRAQVKFNKFLKAGTVMKNYSHVLVLLLRLRQVCFHPCLIANAEETLQKKEQEKESLKEELENAEERVGRDFVRKVKKQRLELALERIKAEKQGGEVADDECPVCMESPEQNENGAIVTACRHIFCRSCAEEFIAAPAHDDHDDGGSGKKCKENQRPCPICRAPVGLKELYKLDAFEPNDFELATETGDDSMQVDADDIDETLGGFIVDDDEEDNGPKKKKSSSSSTASKRRVITDSDEEHSEAEEVPEPGSSRQGKGKEKEKAALEIGWMKEQEPSAKMLWALAKLESIWAEAPDDKIILISSFTTALDLMDDFLRSKGIRTTRYQGDMNRASRDESLRCLKKSKKCKVMLLSLKAGGVGLTLTRANRIIALDLAWSPAVEHQAFDRVHRIGQTKDVFVERLTIANSVEQRILDLQQRKQDLTEHAFGEGKGKKLGKLTVGDLAALFNLRDDGTVKERAPRRRRGPVIAADDH